MLAGSNYSNPDPKSDYKIVIFNVISGISKRIFFGPLGLIWFTNQGGRSPPLDPPLKKKLLLVLKTVKPNITFQLLR